MKKFVELPIIEPMYGTLHFQGVGSATLSSNMSVRNWYLNRVMIPNCTRNFLWGATTPQMGVVDSHWCSNPHFEKYWYAMRFVKGHMHAVIKNMLDAGYYVYYETIDDYYVEGKSWYHERHFIHDGCICGYNDSDKTYCIYAYDKDWVYRKFWTSQKSFEAGRKSAFKQGKVGQFCAFRPKPDTVVFSARAALIKLEEYLDSSIDKYPDTELGPVYGIAVQDYMVEYINKLYDGSIPYERMDRRVFRFIWEHKRVMLERIQCIEKELSMDSDISNRYEQVVADACTAHALYASYRLKRRDSILPVIKSKTITFSALEKELLTELIHKTKEIK